MRITFNSEARRELIEVATWYADRAGTPQARDFRNEVDHALRLLSEHPAMGTPGSHDTRSLVMHRYPYSVVYRLQADTLRILAIASHCRRPGYWTGRR